MATNSELNIIIKAQDEAAAKLNEVSSSLDKLGGSAQSAAQQHSNLGTAVFSGVAAWDLLKGGIEKVSGFIEKSIDEAKEAGRAQNQLNAVLASTKGVSGETSQSINQLAESLQKATGEDKEAIISGQNMLLTFTHIGKDVFPGASKAMLDMATAMNGGLKPSAEQLRNTAMQLGIALNDPITGIARLHRVGVEFTEVQKEQIKHFVEAGESAKAQGVIIAELGTEFGNAAAASKTPADDMNNAIRDMQISIGQALLPTIREWQERIATLVEEITVFISKNQDTIFEVGKMTAAALGAVTALIAVQKGFMLVRAAAIALAEGTLVTPFGLAVIAMAAAAAGIMYLSDKFGGLQNAFAAIGAGIESLGEVILIGIKTMANALVGFLNDELQKGNDAYNFISGLLKKVGVDIGTADLKISVPFDTAENEKTLAAIGDTVNKMQDAATKAKQIAKDESDAKIKDQMDAQAKLAALSDKMQKLQNDEAANGALASDSGAKAAAAALQKHADAVDKLKDEYAKTRDGIVTELASIDDAHKKSVDSIKKNISQVETSLSDLQATYKNTQNTLNQTLSTSQASNTDNAATAVVAQENKIADLKKQISTETNTDNLISLNAELKKEQDSMTANADFIKSIQTQVDAARTRSSNTDLQNAIDDYNTKQAAAQKDYNDKIAALNADTKAKKDALTAQLTDYQTQLTAENDLYAQKVTAIQAMQDQANILYQKGVEDNFKMTTDYVNKEIQLYQNLAAAVSKVSSSSSGAISTIKAPTISGARASGGPVNSGETYLVGENGPELFIPASGGNIAPNGSGSGSTNIVVNITGNKISKDLDMKNLAEEVSRSIVNKLKLNIKLSV